MIDALIWVIAAPLIGALMTVMLPRSANVIGIVSVLASVIAAVFVTWLVASEGPVVYALDAGLWFWVAVVLAGSLLSAAYVFRVLSHAFGQALYPTRALTIGREEIPALALGLVATLLLGLASAPIWPLLERTVNMGGIAP